MARAGTSVAILLIVLAGVSSGLPAAYADTNMAARMCVKTRNPTLCMVVLKVNPKSAYASTEQEVGSVALQIASDTAEYNVGVIVNLNKGNLGTPEGGALAQCLWAYQDADNNLKHNARIGFDRGDYVGTMALVSAAEVVGDLCENAFKTMGKISPVSMIDRQMVERCGVAYELITLLNHE
ncbi:Pectinesterase inhibitor [Hordeum vulgare]|nr:Pectinesterase inhibitor [Hordeum vulgare]